MLTRSPLTPPLAVSLRLDACLVAAAALVIATLASPLSRFTGLDPAFLRILGVALLPWAAFVGWTAWWRPQRALPVIVGNVLWIVASVAVLIVRTIDPNAIGTAIVLAQALLVACLAVWQGTALWNHPAGIATERSRR